MSEGHSSEYRNMLTGPQTYRGAVMRHSKMLVAVVCLWTMFAVSPAQARPAPVGNGGDAISWSDCLYSQKPLHPDTVVRNFIDRDSEIHALKCRVVKKINDKRGFDEDTEECINKVLTSKGVDPKRSGSNLKNMEWKISEMRADRNGTYFLTVYVITHASTGDLVTAYTKAGDYLPSPPFLGLRGSDYRAEGSGDWSGCLGQPHLPPNHIA